LNINSLLDIIRTRRSIRRYQDRPIPREILERLLEAAIWAPSAHNRQPWRFVVVTRAEDRRRLAEAMAARLRRDLEADGVAPEVIEADVARSLTRLTGAPALILVCMTMIDMDTYPDAKRQEAERIMAVQSVAMAAQNALLAAHAQGLGACWMCAPLFSGDVVRETLDLSDDLEPQGLIALGFPAEEREKTRAPLGSRVTFL
jgi:F420 biosynthesis protein FbiB-like protein